MKTITTYGSFRIVSTVNLSPSTGSGAGVWGSITGVLADQTDLATELASKAASMALSDVAWTGKYADLSGRPTLFSGLYADLLDKPALAAIATTGNFGDLTNVPGSITGGVVVANASRDLTLADINKTLINNSTTATLFTILDDATAQWPDGAFSSVCGVGTGIPAFAAGAGVTFRNPDNIVAAQYKPIAALRIGPNEWVLF